MPKSLKHQILIACVAGCVFLTRLGSTDLWDEDEAFFAATAAEMHQRGDWIVPWYNGEVFSHKPPLMYWMMRCGFLLCGEGELGARLFSALFGMASALMTYHIGRLLFDASTGLWAGLAMSSCLMFSVVSRAATADSYLVFFITSALYLYLRATPAFQQRGEIDLPADLSAASNAVPIWTPYLPADRWGWWPIYAVMGLAVLTKGPIGILLPGMTIGLFLLCRAPILPPPRSSESADHQAVSATSHAGGLLDTIWQYFHPARVADAIRVMQPLTAMLAVLLVAGPWFALVGWQTNGVFLQEFFGVHNVGRFLAPMENHRGSIIYYLPVAAIGFFPWSSFVLPTVFHLWSRLKQGHQEHPGWLFLACWVVAMVGFFSLARTKLPNYILPAYPAFALLTAGFLKQWVTSPAHFWRQWPNLAFGTLAIVGLGIFVAILVMTRVEYRGQPLLVACGVNETVLPSMAALWWLGLPLLAGSLGAFWFERRHRLCASLRVVAVTAPVFVMSLLIVGAERLNPHQTSRRIVEFIDARAVASPMAEYSHALPSLVYYAERPVVRLSDPAAVSEFLAEHDGGYLVTTREGWERLPPAAMEGLSIIHELPRFPRPGSVLVIGREPARTASPAESRPSRVAGLPSGRTGE